MCLCVRLCVSVCVCVCVFADTKDADADDPLGGMNSNNVLRDIVRGLTITFGATKKEVFRSNLVAHPLRLLCIEDLYADRGYKKICDQYEAKLHKLPLSEENKALFSVIKVLREKTGKGSTFAWLHDCVGWGSALKSTEAPFLVYCDHGRLFLRNVWEKESRTAAGLAKMIQSPADPIAFEPAIDATLNAEQQRAVQVALVHRVSAIYGAGGTGKTQTFVALQKNFMAADGLCVTIAPTGIAVMNAKRRSVPGVFACTLQSFCNAVLRSDSTFICADDVNETQIAKKDEKTSDFYKSIDAILAAARVLVLVDESSMVSLSHADVLVQALQKLHCASVVFAGDNCQLPPISYGAVFRDVIAALHTSARTELVQQYRQKHNSALTRSTLGLRDDDVIVPCPNVPEDDSFVSKVVTTEIHGANKIVQQLSDWKAREGVDDCDFYPRVMVICTTKTLVSAVNNAVLHKLAPAPSLDSCRCKSAGEGTCAHSIVWMWEQDSATARAVPLFWPGVRVACLKNDHAADIVNGMRGVVTRVRVLERFEHEDAPTRQKRVVYEIDVFWDNAGRPSALTLACLEKKFDSGCGNLKYCVAFDARKQLDYAYALTVHKAQSTEADFVAYLQDTKSFFLNRRQAYTAMSRSKREFVVFTVSPRAEDCVTRWITLEPERQTRLKEALQLELELDEDEDDERTSGASSDTYADGAPAAPGKRKRSEE